MSYLHWLFVLMAVFSAVPACTLISPVRVPARAVPIIMIIVALVVSFLPVHAILAMACVGPVAYLYKRLGIEPGENEPADYSKVTEATRSAAQMARDRLRKAEPTEVTVYADKAYPAPGEAADAAPGDTDDTDDTADTVTTLTDDEPAKPFDWRKRLHEVEQARAANAGRRLRVMPEASVRP